MRNAIDFSFARPSVADVAARNLDILVYTGSAMPSAQYLRDMRAAGVSVTLIQESDPNRAQQGFNAGVADSNYANSKAAYVGYPADAAICFVVSDGSATEPSTGGADIAAYALGVQSNSLRPFFFYGNRYAVDHAMQGAPKGLGCWVPSTWGANANDLLVQEPNIPSPIPDTDFNTVHHPYGAWGQSTIPGDDDVTTEAQMGTIGQWMKDSEGRIEGVLGQWLKDVEARIEAKIAAIPAGSGGGLTSAQVQALIRAELDKTKLGS